MNSCRFKKKIYRDELQEIVSDVIMATRMVRLCDRYIRDNRGKLHTKVGRNAATSWEIRAVHKIRTGESWPEGSISRTDFITNVSPQGDISITSKPNYRFKVNESATAEELAAEYEKTFNTQSPIVPGVRGGGGYGSANPYAISKDNGKLVQSLADIAKVVGLISAIVATVGAIKVGPAADTIRQTAHELGNLGSFVKNAGTKLGSALKART